MFGFEKIDKFLSVFVKDPIEAQSGQCVKNLSKTSLCQYCVPACHANAINLNDGLDLDITKCDGCGFCAQACPNGVFDVNAPSDIELLAQIKLVAKESQVLTLTCKQHLVGKLRPNEISITCMGRLNEGFLLAAAIYGLTGISLDTSHCDDCDTFRPELLDQTLKISNDIAAQLDIDFEAAKSNENIERQIDDEKKDGPDHGMHLSRRNFFEHLKKRTVDSTSELIISSIPDFEEENKGLTKRVPANRSLLKQVVQRLKKEDTAMQSPDLFFSIKLEDSCVACDFCANLCPTAALEKSAEGDSVTLSFTPFLCTGCKLCINVCPFMSIAVEPDGKPVRVNEKNILIDAVLVKCSECGVEFASRDGVEKCMFCKKKEQLFT